MRRFANPLDRLKYPKSLMNNIGVLAIGAVDGGYGANRDPGYNTHRPARLLYFFVYLSQRKPAPGHGIIFMYGVVSANFMISATYAS